MCKPLSGTAQKLQYTCIWQCLFCHKQQKYCCNYFGIRWSQLVELVMW